jgi:hypothetical protein
MADGPPLSRSVRMTSAETSKSDLLDFPAWSAQVYSNANQWLHFIGTNQFVGPGQQGAIVSLPGFTEFAIEWAAPPGSVQGPAATGTEVDIVFYSVWMPPSPGLSAALQQTPKPYDGEASGIPANAGLHATATLQGVAGRRWMCATLTVSLALTGAGTDALEVDLLDGPSGSTNKLWATVIGITGAGAGPSTVVALSGLAYSGTAGNAMTVEFIRNSGGNIYQIVTFGAYLV